MRQHERERDACGIGFVANARGAASHEIVALAVEALRRVRHRGALAADARSGDGAGLLLPIPRRILGGHGVGMAFLPPTAAGRARTIVERGLREEGLAPAGWREVPVDESALGGRARRTRPLVAQVLFDADPAGPAGPIGDPEHAAFRARRRIERSARAAGVPVYLASCSFSTVTYKALCAAEQLARFYPDLLDPVFEAWFAVFHQRYSTNTAPTWERAQPFRFLSHNGEINTIAGNEAAMRAREGRLGAPDGDEDALRPSVDPSGSDSALLDNAVELLVRGGRELAHAVTMLVPEAWEGNRELDQAQRDFHEYHACLTEPWDGPAALAFADGRVVGAALDRNGLRPLRYAVCADGLVACGSEAGLVDLGGRGRITRGRLGPGQILLVDPAGGGVLEDFEVKRDLTGRQPYGVWVSCHLRRGDRGLPAAVPADDPTPEQVAFGYTKEEITAILRPMATRGDEPVSSMGDDTAGPSLANRPRSVFDFLRQRFAQVTNPPIDHLHERTVMSLRTLIGPRAPLLSERPDAASLVELPSFFLYPDGLDRLWRGPFIPARLDATFPADHGPTALEAACGRLAAEAERAVRDGAALLVVCDRGVDAARAPVPALLAAGAVHQHLVRTGLRTRTSIVVDTGEAREVHHLACLLGYGADAIVPRLALETVAHLCVEGRLSAEGTPAPVAQERLRVALEEGLLKVMSKMGISTLSAYRGAQVFEAYGLAGEVVDRCLTGTASPLGGLGFEDLGANVLELHARAYGTARPALVNVGFVKHRAGGEYHATNPEVVEALHAALGVGDRPAEGRDGYRRFAALVDGRPAAAPRDLLEVAPAGPPIPLADVEPAPAIVRRFSAGAMSLGALSAEAHETLALGLRMAGARANTGEGGEDPDRYRTAANAAIKQVASGRFGVTPEYCAFAEELQIKMTQGSKPGEGGQLPGHKVSAEIARLRHTPAGITLVSPPPHHDIYSIEDLAQLIYDLKQVNPRATVSVKLTSTTGVGVVATGVAKALADVIHVAGGDGGTGASPLSSIKHAGMPWEIGLAEVQRELVESGLRTRVRLRADGGMKTGRDVLIAALLGADEFSFGTALLLSAGCIMVRACHRDTCPTGIATQRPELRARFSGTAEQVAAYLHHVAEDLRTALAGLGLGSIDEAVGRVDLLRPRATGVPRVDALDPARLATFGPGSPPIGRFLRRVPLQRPVAPLGERLAADALPALRAGRSAELSYRITNGDRSVGARLGGALARAHGASGPPGRLTARFRGEAGQSFGAFLVPGVELVLTGEANDHVGKGMAGGRIVVRPPEDDAGDPVLVGNAALYGATGGELFCAGRAGERFAVRNSGAVAVVEGIGDHGCEYMTMGAVVVLGPVGRNFAAGMTGGEVHVFDPDGMLPRRLSARGVVAGRPEPAELERLRRLVVAHRELTGSTEAATILSLWDQVAAAFVRVAPEAGAGAADHPSARPRASAAPSAP